MRKLMNKKLNKKGFTLMEMLIVVAIIAILVAIAIPTFTKSLNKAKIAADEANLRAFYAEEVSNYILDNTDTPTEATGASSVHVAGVDYALQYGTYTATWDSTKVTYKIVYTDKEGATVTIPGAAKTAAPSAP